MPILALGVSFVVGTWARRVGASRFSLLFRGQLVVLSSTLALVTGWSAPLGRSSLVGMAVLLGAEVVALILARSLARRGVISPPAAASAASNSGFWSIPVSGMLFGASGAAFAVIYDVVAVPRAALLVHTLRRSAPDVPSRRSALVDYMPQLALCIGLVLRHLLPAPTLGLVQPLGLTVGMAGFLLLGMAMPVDPPRAVDWRRALPALPLRFGLPTALCLLAHGAGLRLPDPVWVLALARSPFIVVSLSRLYGYRREEATAIPLLTVPAAVALLPVVAWLAR